MIILRFSFADLSSAVGPGTLFLNDISQTGIGFPSIPKTGHVAGRNV